MTTTRGQLAREAVAVAEALLARRVGYAVKAGFDPSQPRDAHGQWSETGVGGGIVGFSPHGNSIFQINAEGVLLTDNEIRLINNTIARSGGSRVPVSVKKDLGELSVEGIKGKVAGYYDPNTKEIVLSERAVKRFGGPDAILAHEIQHAKFDAFKDTDRWNFYQEGPIMRQLLASGRSVSDYALAFWNDLTMGGITDFAIAVDETLAEMARIKASGSRQEFDPIWERLYADVRGAWN